MAIQSVEANAFGKKVVTQLTAEQTQEIERLVLWINGITEIAGIAACAAEHQPSDECINNALWAVRDMTGRIGDIIDAGRPTCGRG